MSPLNGMKTPRYSGARGKIYESLVAGGNRPYPDAHTLLCLLLLTGGRRGGAASRGQADRFWLLLQPGAGLAPARGGLRVHEGQNPTLSQPLEPKQVTRPDSRRRLTSRGWEAKPAGKEARGARAGAVERRQASLHLGRVCVRAGASIASCL